MHVAAGDGDRPPEDRPEQETHKINQSFSPNAAGLKLLIFYVNIF
jgi:hypothetical protein